MLQNGPLVTKIDLDAVENAPSKFWLVPLPIPPPPLPPNKVEIAGFAARQGGARVHGAGESIANRRPMGLCRKLVDLHTVCGYAVTLCVAMTPSTH